MSRPPIVLIPAVVLAVVAIVPAAESEVSTSVQDGAPAGGSRVLPFSRDTSQEENVPRSRGEEANRAKSRDEGEILELRLDLRHEPMYHIILRILKAELDA